MSLAAVVTVFLGFARTYYLRSYYQTTPLPLLVQLHGLVFTSWIVLFFVQTVLIASHRVSVHRRLGLAGAGLAALLVMVGLATAVGSARRNVAIGGTGALAFLATPFGDMLVFAILATAGILYRHRPETHKRLMLVATIALLSAPISRWPLAIIQRGPVTLFLVTDLFVLAGVGYDLASRRRIHPAYVWGGLLLVMSQPVRLAISHTDAWLAFANKLVR